MEKPRKVQIYKYVKVPYSDSNDSKKTKDMT